MIIGFIHKTSKILPRIFCQKFRHCAIILEHNKHRYIMVQIRLGNVQLIPLKKRDLKILTQHGWVFIPLDKGGKSFNEPSKFSDLEGLFDSMQILTNNPPIFIYSLRSLIKIPPLSRGMTCVSFAKRTLNINAPFVWTPYQLYKYLKNKMPRCARHDLF